MKPQQRMHRYAEGRSLAARGWLLALFAALLLSPLLGQVHGVLHPAHLPGVSAAQTAVSTSDNADAVKAKDTAKDTAEGLAGALASLFSGHDSGDCRLYDQFSHGDQNVAVPFIAFPAAFAPVLVAVVNHGHTCAEPPVSRARGPPALR